MPHINLFWLYDLPNWIFGVLVVAFFTVYGLVRLFTTRKWVRSQHREDHHSHNDIVSYFLAAITVFYGITLGLLAVATIPPAGVVASHCGSRSIVR